MLEFTGRKAGVWVAAFNKVDADDMDYEDAFGGGMMGMGGMGGMYGMGMMPGHDAGDDAGDEPLWHGHAAGRRRGG